MKFTDVKTLEHFLKEYSYNSSGKPTPSGQQSIGQNAKADDKDSITPQIQPIPIKNIKKDTAVVDKKGNELGTVVSTVGNLPAKDSVVVQDKNKKLQVLDKDTQVDVASMEESKLSKLAKRKNKKLQIKKIGSKLKKLSRKRLKEADPKLFEINFNRKEVATEALDMPVKCGFEAETFFYSVNDSRTNVDDMSIGDIEYEFGDLPDQAYQDYQDWLYDKGQSEYLDDLVSEKIDEVREDEEWLNDFIDSSSGPSSEAIEIYKKDFEEADPQEYENREEDGWEYMNWVREYVEEEYEEEYMAWLDSAVREEYDLDDEATENARSDYSMEDWVYDLYSYMSSFLDDYGYDYSTEGSVDGVADELYRWIQDNSVFDSFPETGDYGDTYTTTGWAVEKDSSIDPDEGAAAELISPVYSSPRKMLEEMRTLFKWSEDNFGTNNTTGLHVTMSWNGEPDAPVNDDGEKDSQEPNKLKMALLLGDEYLLAQWSRLRNTYTKSQYQNVLRYAEGMKRGDKESFKNFEKELSKGISREKFSSIHFKNQRDEDTNSELIEFRIMGGADYNTMYEKVVKTVVRYATIMQAGYDEDAYRKDYVNAVFRLLRKSQEIDPKKLKDLESLNHPVIDAAKEIVGKKDYFDVVRMLNNSVSSYNEYQQLTEPDADKEWKQEVADFEKGTGEKLSIVEVEEGEPIRGYIEPNRLSPSKRAPAILQKAQDSFARAITVLARDIADGKARSKPNAKSIRIFREYASELKLDNKKIQDLIIQSIDNLNFNGTDKDNILRLEKGISSLFKQDIIQKPEFITPQQIDVILKKSWQFAMSDDRKDNKKVDQFIKLLQKVSPYLDYDQIAGSLESVLKARQENEFARYMKSGSYGDAGILKTGKVTTPGAPEELLKFLEPYSGYKHPTSPEHHVNIRSDDRYSQVFQMRLMQRLRDRLEHLRELETDDPEKANKLKEKLCDIGMDLLEGLKPQPDLWDEEKSGYRRGNDSPKHLATHDTLERWNDAADKLARMKGEIGEDDWTYNFSSAYDDYVLGSIHIDRYFSWKETEGPEQDYVLKELHKERFAAIKKFYTQFDKIFQGEGFVNLKAEIQAKNTLDRRNKDFEKNVRDKARATFNIPSHSYVYMEREFFDTITDENYSDRAAYLDAHLEHFNEKVNNGEKVYVIPAAHMSQADDAYDGLDLISTLEQENNFYTSWRKTGYRKILQKFFRVYNITYNDLTSYNGKKFFQVGGDEYQKLAELGIDITRKGDSRTGMPGQSDLIDPEELENPISGEPINRGSASYWMSDDDEAKEEMRFKAFDWSIYPEPVKGLVAKELKGMKDDQGFYSLKLAIKDVIDRIQKGDTGISLNSVDNAEGLIMAADVDGYRKDHSAKIGAETNWSNLADYLKIERGVNDQGVDLLKQTYYMYDNNSSGDFAATGVSLERWVDAVQKSYKYITTNYTVSGGNYFRGEDYIGARHGGPDNADKTITTPPEKEFNSDYDKARQDFPMFDKMMQNGMQNYLARGHVNDLVGFLNNIDNDHNFKATVLNTLLNAPESGMGAFDDFQSALASARMNMSRQNASTESKINSDMPSIFEKFENLSLEKQLEVLSKIESKKIDEAYKKATQVKAKEKKPKKRKPSKGHQSPHPYKGRLVGESVPDNTKIRMLNHLLSDKMPANDIKKQMDAFFALPDPKMIKAFRDRRATGGDDACLRPILRSFIKRQMADTQQKFINLNESKLNEYRFDNIDSESPDPERFLIVDSQGNVIKIGANIGSAKIIGIVPPSGDNLGSIITTKGKLPIPNKLGLKIIDKKFKQQELPLPNPEPTQLELPGMNKKKEESLKEYEDLEAEKTKIQDIVSKLDIENEKDRELIDQIWRILNADHIQTVIGKLVVKPIADETAMNKEAATKVLTQVIYQIESSYDKIKEFLDDLEKTGSAYDVDALKQPINALSNVFKSDVGYTVFKTLLPYGVGSNKKGPGEFALAMLSDRVQLSDTTGDIVVDGELVEVKASKSETSSGGGRLGMGGMPQLQARDLLLRYKDVIPSVASHLDDEGNKTLGISNFVKYLNQDLPVGDKRRYDITKEFYKDLFIPASVEKIAKAFQNSDSDREIALQYAGANYVDYLTKGQFEALLAIDMYTGKTAYISNEEEFMEFQKGDHSGAMGISVVPSNSGPTESFVQMTFIKKGKI
jgi:hypothetical protein